jgi:hypothetical protein
MGSLLWQWSPPLGDLVRRDKSFGKREREQFEWRLAYYSLNFNTLFSETLSVYQEQEQEGRSGKRDTGSLRKVSTQAEIERAVLLRRTAAIGTWVRVSIHPTPPSSSSLSLSSAPISTLTSVSMVMMLWVTLRVREWLALRVSEWLALRVSEWLALRVREGWALRVMMSAISTMVMVLARWHSRLRERMRREWMAERPEDRRYPREA